MSWFVSRETCDSECRRKNVRIFSMTEHEHVALAPDFIFMN